MVWFLKGSVSVEQKESPSLLFSLVVTFYLLMQWCVEIFHSILTTVNSRLFEPPLIWNSRLFKVRLHSLGFTYSTQGKTTSVIQNFSYLKWFFVPPLAKFLSVIRSNYEKWRILKKKQTFFHDRNTIFQKSKVTFK